MLEELLWRSCLSRSCSGAAELLSELPLEELPLEEAPLEELIWRNCSGGGALEELLQGLRFTV